MLLLALIPPAQSSTHQARHAAPPTVWTKAVYVVFTDPSATRAALHVAHKLARALGVPMTIVDFRVARYPLNPDWTLDRSPAEAEEFAHWLQQHDIEARVRVLVCRSPREAFGMAFRPHSLIVLGGRHHWWPTRSMRMRRALEAAGHVVLLIDEAAHAA
jgi:hypothetical protein